MTESNQNRTSQPVSGIGRYSDQYHSQGLSSGNEGGER
jgi:hypothetical protein